MKPTTVQQIIEFFKQKWANNHCPFCGSYEWSVASNGNGTPYITHSPFKPDMKLGRITDPINPNSDFVSFIIIRCENCKYTAYFDYQAILMELEDAKQND